MKWCDVFWAFYAMSDRFAFFQKAMVVYIGNGLMFSLVFSFRSFFSYFERKDETYESRVTKGYFCFEEMSDDLRNE
jgi:hypothetical protein